MEQKPAGPEDVGKTVLWDGYHLSLPVEIKLMQFSEDLKWVKAYRFWWAGEHWVKSCHCVRIMPPRPPAPVERLPPCGHPWCLPAECMGQQ